MLLNNEKQANTELFSRQAICLLHSSPAVAASVWYSKQGNRMAEELLFVPLQGWQQHHQLLYIPSAEAHCGTVPQDHPL